MPWSDDMIPRLRSLWDEGLSTAEIGRRLGVSKNAVVGKAHRLYLPARPQPVPTRTYSGQSPKQCAKGHDLTGDNLAQQKGRWPRWRCRQCERDRHRVGWKRRAEAVAA